MSGDHNSGHNNIGHNCGHVQSAWDTETVTRTVWHPGTSGEGASTTMYSQHRLVIHRVTVTQYQVSRHNLPSSTSISDNYPKVGVRLRHQTAAQHWGRHEADVGCEWRLQHRRWTELWVLWTTMP